MEIRIMLIAFSAVFVCGLLSTPVEAQTPAAEYSYFSYIGNDARFDRQIDTDNEYFNPILSGFYPDPSVTRKGDDYYLVVSSFSYYPGVPIFHSRDLVNWTQLGHVLNRPSQLKVDGVRLSGGIYAPDIAYNKFNDTFYMITTCVDSIGNFFVTTDDPHSQNWSDPVVLPRVGGIDPSFFFDVDGQAYIIHNDEPQGPAEYDGHRAIWLHRFDTKSGQTVGEPVMLIDGGVDKSQKPIWIEGPHIYNVGGRYFLMAAEGGTSVNHTEVIFTSDKVDGPYVPYAGNPILSQRELAEPRKDIVTSVGHADLIDTPQGDWYAVFLGCRPYEGNHYNTGRETFLLPVDWTDGYPVILPLNVPVPTVVSKKLLQPLENTLTGNFTWRDDFDGSELRNEWIFIRNPRGDFWRIADGKMCIEPTNRSINDVDNPAFIGRRQQHENFGVETELTFTPQNEGDFAGLAVYQNEKYNFVFGKTVRNDRQAISLLLTEGGKITELFSSIIPEEYLDLPVKLKVSCSGEFYNAMFGYEDSPADSNINIDARLFSTETAGGFTGVVIGMYATTDQETPPPNN